MYALDFEYDNRYLSDYGFIVCDFNGSNGVVTSSAGAKISFDKVSVGRGEKHSFIGSKYDECISATFDICKDPDKYVSSELPVSEEEERDLLRWLNRNDFHRFQVLKDKGDPCFFNASFNLERIKIREIVYGFRLTMETDAPFGYGEEKKKHFLFEIGSLSKMFYDISDVVGFIRPDLKIKLAKSGNFEISNNQYNEKTIIKNCVAGETIIFHGFAEIIESDVESHDISNDFNYTFFKIGNTLENRNNVITVSLPCEIELKYAPIVKLTV